MTTPSAINTDILKTSLLENYGISSEKLIPLSLGADLKVQIFKVIAKHGQSYFLKTRIGKAIDIAPSLVRFLADSGIEGVIPPILSQSQQPSVCESNLTLTLYPFKTGQDGFSNSLNSDQWRSLGKTLKQVHELRLPNDLIKNIPRESFATEQQKKAHSLLALIENKSWQDPISKKMQDFCLAQSKIISEVLAKAEALNSSVLNSSLDLHLCHSDLHAGNVFVDEKQNLFIVDWDEPILAPIERDLMFIGAGVGLTWNDPLEVEIFYKGYGNTQINPELLSFYRLNRILVDIAEYGQELLLSNHEGSDRKEYLKHFMDQFAPNGVIEIALKGLK